MVLLEVPSGYFSDKIGRRATLIVGSFSFVVAYSCFSLATDFNLLLFAQVALAVGISFVSGTDVSFHFDSLKELGLENEFGEREAKCSRLGFISMGIATVFGGYLGTIDLALPYHMSIVTSLGLLWISICFKEPQHKDAAEDNFSDQLKECFGYFSNKVVRSFFIFMVLMIALKHIPYEFIQSYIQNLTLSDNFSLYTGIHGLVVTLVAAYFAGRSNVFSEKFGIVAVCSFALLVQVVMILLMGFSLSYVVLTLCLFRSVPDALVKAPINKLVAENVSEAHRATFFSLLSLSGRLSFAFVLFSFHLYSSENSWSQASTLLITSGVVSSIFAVLWYLKAIGRLKTE